MVQFKIPLTVLAANESVCLVVRLRVMQSHQRFILERKFGPLGFVRLIGAD